MINNLPKKRVASGALIFQRGKILIVKPKYKNYWSFPGGMIETFESPSQGLKRELKEETGLDIKVIKPLAIEHLIRRPKDPEDESIQFLFLCKLAKGEKFSNIKLARNEISEYNFVSINEAMEMTSERSAKRLKAGLESFKRDSIIYLESKYD